MNKKIYLLKGVYAVLFVSYIRWCYGDPFIFLTGKKEGIYDAEQVLWIVLFLPVWFFAYHRFGQECSIGVMAIIRYRSIIGWWKRLQARILLELSGTYLLMGILLFCLSYESFNVRVWLVILIHALFLFEIGVLLWVLSGKMIISAISIIILEGIANKLITQHQLSPQYNPFSWGMYCFNKMIYGEKGYWIYLVIGIQMLLVVLSFLLFNLDITQNTILLRRIGNEKNDRN